MKFEKISRRKFVLSTLLITPMAALADAFWWENKWIRTRQIRVGNAKPTHRIVHFTDLHHKGDRAFLQRIVTEINALSPDLVCFTGDMIEEAKHLPEALELLREIKSPLYGVPGNHDYWAKVDFPAINECFKATGGVWLMNEQVTTADGKLCVSGASCSRWFKDPRPKFAAPRPGLKNLMLLHYPVFVENLSHQYDLILAGHSHGGQVRLPFYGSLLTPSATGRYELGLFQTPAGPLYVNPGLGWFAYPIRFNCRPEITVFEV